MGSFASTLALPAAAANIMATNTNDTLRLIAYRPFISSSERQEPLAGLDGQPGEISHCDGTESRASPSAIP